MDGKFDEKGMEKREEKSADEKAAGEKSWDEKYRRDPLGTIVWAFIFIWAGLVLLANNMGWLDNLIKPYRLPGGEEITGLEAWPLILLGAGVIVLIEVVVRVLVPTFRRPVTGSLIFAIILISLGLGDLISWGVVWAVVLIILGASILFRGFTRRSE